jgi:hypothetical protein
MTVRVESMEVAVLVNHYNIALFVDVLFVGRLTNHSEAVLIIVDLFPIF